ncbi:ornithine carbamoyltransferase [Pseudoclavibacter sp. VKM Ac-2867]|uniref:ornithine carbamoyltransferase n=1 Tax=Pseudoclavibacter sp. VKM Ac-2867 TaxID=2783829 RepID=UPI00188A2CC3|nr:ornithine carbamoyltransferase [Pseudoclavibacter sp. VKM Ac-2867]MBF4459442.1 ornithine carbamoyltransferase [Pseudoclavibacter sp. VKM Ac-2867]
MSSLLRLDDWSRPQVDEVFSLADAYETDSGPSFKGTAVMFFPPSSLRTRVTFERGASLMGLQPIVFPSETLDKPERLSDVAQYLALWADTLVVRHPDLSVLEELAATHAVPVVNAMTRENHPCEVLSDLYALRARRDLDGLRYLFVGADGNIARGWQEAARALDLDLVQCCPANLASPGSTHTEDLREAIRAADVVLTDAVGQHGRELAPYRITGALLDTAPEGVDFLPCPPFTRGNEVSADAIEHSAFVGHRFKKPLLPVHQAIIAFCLLAS